MSFYSSVLRRRLLTIAKLGADFSIVYNGAEYKLGDTVTITASTTITVKGNGKAKVTLIGAGGGGAGAVDSSLDYQGGDGGDGGTSIFTVELTSGNYSVIVGIGGNAGNAGYIPGGTGGETSAFGHSASGGFGGSPATEWNDGSDGKNGSGETANGNDTKYGQGGIGDWYDGRAGSDGVCIIKILDSNSNDCTVILSGTFDASNSYVTIAGEKVTTPGEYLVPVGDFVTLSIKKASSFGNAGGIYINGTRVVDATTTLQSYDYEVDGNCTITGEVSGTNMARSHTIKVVSA